MSKHRRSKSKGILAVIFCIPLAFIIYFSVLYSSQSISIDDVDKVTVSAPNSESVVFEDQKDLDFFVEMFSGARQLQDKPRDISDETPVYIILEENGRVNEYKFYPSLNLSGCMLVAENGDMYVLEQESAKEMSLRDEFGYLYSSYFLPKLYVVSGDSQYEVMPLESTWNYYKSDGVLYDYTPSAYATGEEIYPIVKGLDNSWTFSPDSNKLAYEVSDMSYVTANGVEYNIDNITELNLSADTVVTVAFTASWSSRNGAQAFGTAKYKFNILYDVPATIELPEHDFQIGDVIEIYAANLNEDEPVELETLLNVSDVDFGMVSSDTGVALVPIGTENAPGPYDLIIHTSIGDVNEVVNVSERESGEWIPIAATTDQYNEMLSPQKLSEFKEILKTVTASRPETDYFVYGENEGESGLHLPVSISSEIKYEFGQTVNLAVSDISGDSGERTVEGIVYELEEGTSVRSAQVGEVVYSGVLAPTGNTVVIYHGYGIYTYYFHLESAIVQVGNTVTDGEIIGTAGKSGFTADKTVLHYAVSIDGTFVDPMWFYSAE